MYKVIYDYRVWKEDFEEIDKASQKIIIKNIEKKLFLEPRKFGKNLRAPFSGFYKLRVGSYRIIYAIENDTVIIFIIGHRRYVYEKLLKRI